MADKAFGVPVDWDKLAPELLAGGAGAVDELLYGIPEFVAKKIDRKAVEDYIGKHQKAYKTGETIGTVGSIFMPVPGGRAIKSADTLADILKLAGRGALAGAGEAGVRGVTSEKSIDQILKDIQTGATWGGVGGAAGGLISKGLSKAGKRAVPIAEEAVKKSDQAMLGTVEGLTGRSMNQLVKETAGPGARGLGKFAKSDFTRTAAAKIARENRLDLPGNAEKYFAKVSQDWDDIGKAFETVFPDARGSQILTEAAARGADDIADIAKMPGGKDVVARLQNHLENAKDLQGINPIKSYLANVAKDTFKAPDSNTAEAERALVNVLRRNIDDMSMDAAEKLGLDIDFAKRKANYIFDRSLADAMSRAETKPMRISTGSPTMEKLGFGLAGATLGGISGAADESLTPQERMEKALKQAGIGLVGGLGASAAKAATSKALGTAIAKGRPLAELATKVAPTIERAAEKLTPGMGAAAGGQAASIIARNAVKEAAPDTPKEESAAQAGATAGAGDTPAYISQIMDRMKMYAQIKGVKVDSPEFAQFAQQVYQVTNGFAPDKIAGILYPDEGERAAYLKALSAAQRLSQTLPGALAEKPGFLQSESEEATMSRTSAIDQLASLVGDVAKESGTEKEAKAQLNKILASRESPERKTQLIKFLLAQYGVDVDKLAALGVA